eukprot:366512-Chlamydomonas_euryale.AAC.20
MGIALASIYLYRIAIQALQLGSVIGRHVDCTVYMPATCWQTSTTHPQKGLASGWKCAALSQIVTYPHQPA